MGKLGNLGDWISISERPPNNKMMWDDVRAFLAVARSGTLSAAAGALGIGVATLSRRIDRFEHALGLPLFVRHQSGYQLTQDGSDLIEKAEQIEIAALSLSSDAALQSQVSGRVRLATAENLANGLILPNLGEFCARYPDLVIEVITDISTVNVHRRDADIAVRMVKPERGNVSVRRIGTLGYGLYGSADYVDRRVQRENRANFENDAFISWNEIHADLPAAQWVDRVLRGRKPAITTTSLSTQIAAAVGGMGLAVIPHFLAAHAGLVCLWHDIGIDQPIYLVIQSDLTQSRRTRALADFLSDLVIKNKNKLSGY